MSFEGEINNSDILTLPGVDKVLLGKEGLSDQMRIIEIVASATHSVETDGMVGLVPLVCGFTEAKRVAFLEENQPWVSPIFENALNAEEAETTIGRFLVQEAKRFLSLETEEIQALSTEDKSYFSQILPLAKSFLLDVMYRDLYQDSSDNLNLWARTNLVRDISPDERAAGESNPEYKRINALIDRIVEDQNIAQAIKNLSGGSVNRLHTLVTTNVVPKELVVYTEEILKRWLSDNEQEGRYLEELSVKIYAKLFKKALKYGATADLLFEINGLPVGEELQSQVNDIQSRVDHDLPLVYTHFTGGAELNPATWERIMQACLLHRDTLGERDNSSLLDIANIPTLQDSIGVETEAEAVTKALLHAGEVMHAVPVLKTTLARNNYLNLIPTVYSDLRGWNISMRIKTSDGGYRDINIVHANTWGYLPDQIRAIVAHEGMHATQRFFATILRDAQKVTEGGATFSSTQSEFFSEILETEIGRAFKATTNEPVQNQLPFQPYGDELQMQKLGISPVSMLVQPRQIAYGMVNYRFWQRLGELHGEPNNIEDGELKPEVVKRLVQETNNDAITTYKRVYQGIGLEPTYRGASNEIGFPGDGLWYIGLNSSISRKLELLVKNKPETPVTEVSSIDYKSEAIKILRSRFEPAVEEKDEVTPWVKSKDARLVWFGLMHFSVYNKNMDDWLGYLRETTPEAARDQLQEIETLAGVTIDW